MRIFDLIRLAFKVLKGRWAVLAAAGVAISAFCLCFAGAVYTTVQEEKALPYEMVVSSQHAKDLSDAAAVEISQIQEVVAATPVLQAPVSLSAGGYTAELTLTAMLPAYIEEAFADGVVFPEDSVMPYIVLNEAACKLFSNGKDAVIDEAPDIDWLNESFSVQLGEGSKAVTARVCGILSGDADTDDSQEPSAYISLSAAKKLLRENGQSADYAEIKARVTNIGQAQSISREIAVLGLSVLDSTGELQAGWDMKQKEMGYLLVTGFFSLVCAAVLFKAFRKIDLLEHKKAWDMLIKLGIKQRSILGLFIIQAIMIALAGIAAGIVVSLSLPAFLPQEAASASIFTLAVPPATVAVVSLVCMVASMASFLKKKTV